jgi:hypothetical protein
MQVKEEIRQHYDNAITTILRHGVPKDTLPNLAIADCLAEGHGR